MVGAQTGHLIEVYAVVVPLVMALGDAAVQIVA
jgi:hypothetical protein